MTIEVLSWHTEDDPCTFCTKLHARCQVDGKYRVVRGLVAPIGGPYPTSKDVMEMVELLLKGERQ
jgi:hypothetical protein